MTYLVTALDNNTLRWSGMLLHSPLLQPQISVPDVIIWMMSGAKRLASARLPAHRLMYIPPERWKGCLPGQGDLCGKAQDIMLTVRWIEHCHTSVLLTTLCQYIRWRLTTGCTSCSKSCHSVPAICCHHINMGSVHSSVLCLCSHHHSIRVMIPMSWMQEPSSTWFCGLDWRLMPNTPMYGPQTLSVSSLQCMQKL